MTTIGSGLRAGIPIVLAVAAGYFGGALRERLYQARSLDKVSAARFEVLDGAGRPVVVLASNPLPQGHQDAGAALTFTDPRGVRRCELGTSLGDSTPFLRLYGGDGAERVRVQLGYRDDPVVTLRDGQRIRAILGARHGDMAGPSEDKWSLSLFGRKEGVAADIGFQRWLDDSYQAAVTLLDGTGREWRAVAGEPMKPVPIPLRKGR
jgi:hypothetical protein